MNARPRILITRAEDVTGERWDDYADRVTAAGGEPVAADLDGWTAGAEPQDYDGVIVTGGVDVDPARYNEPPSERLGPIDPDRDAFEAALIQHALEHDRPLLAICRGHQLFNVVHGGSLLQHIEERDPHRARRGDDGGIASGWHDVEVTPGTILAGILGDTHLRVNSRHHQAVTDERVAPGLTVAAVTAGDGIVEALEDPSKRWAVSVQWHPERSEMDGEPSRALFEAFVEACRQT
ncbi:MAG: gamma-glutamyl-gamma-aminobutyrate hydrolase family protein [Dehalococcoidia bacterium]